MTNYFVTGDKVTVKDEIPTFGKLDGEVIRRSPYVKDVAIVEVVGYSHGLAFTDHELMHRRDKDDVATDGINLPR